MTGVRVFKIEQIRRVFYPLKNKYIKVTFINVMLSLFFFLSIFTDIDHSHLEGINELENSE